MIPADKHSNESEWDRIKRKAYEAIARDAREKTAATPEAKSVYLAALRGAVSRMQRQNVPKAESGLYEFRMSPEFVRRLASEPAFFRPMPRVYGDDQALANTVVTHPGERVRFVVDGVAAVIEVR